MASTATFAGPSQVEIYNQPGTAPVPQKDMQYWRGTGLVMAQAWPTTGVAPKVTWLEVDHRYWRATGHRYHGSTEICTGSIPALLRSRLLADTWSQDRNCIMPVQRQPSARHQLSSTGIAPCTCTVLLVNTDMNPTFPLVTLFT